MTSRPYRSIPVQSDEALRLLAHMYSRWFVQSRAPEVPFDLIRDVLLQATSQQDALDHLTTLAVDFSSHRFAGKVIAEAQRWVRLCLEANGSSAPLIVGTTDGFQYQCQTCRAQQRVLPASSERRLRPLLRPELERGRDACLMACQTCSQALAPTNIVGAVFAGTARHGRRCSCSDCNQAGTATLLHLYRYDPTTQEFRLPIAHQISAPSQRQCVERALAHCQEQGWYLLNLDALRLPLQRLRPVREEQT